MTPPLRVDQAERGEADQSNNNQNENDQLNNELRSLLPVTSQLPSLEEGHQCRASLLARARRLLYTSHLFAQFSEVAWQFCLILFLAAFANYKSLILVSSYGLISNGSVFLFGAKVGRFVDESNRLMVAQRFIFLENLCVVVASVLCYILLAKTQQTTPVSGGDKEDDYVAQTNSWWAHRMDGIPIDPLSVCLLIGIHVLGAAAMILDGGFLVAMERDWIVVMSQYATSKGDIHAPASKAWLAKTNVTMKQIDLSCKVAAPAVAGFLIAVMDDGTDPRHGRNLRGAAIMVGAINVAALIVEYICTLRIYRILPNLAIKASPGGNNNNSNTQGIEEGKVLPRVNGWKCLPPSLRVYLDQDISIAGISLSLLYLNVLTFGGIMTAYLVWRGMKLQTVGVWRGVSSAVGLMGTFVYHLSSKRMSQVDTGMWSIVYQFTCLSMSYAALFIEDYVTSMILLILGVCSSRIGLWVFDIAITQLMQEYIPDGIRGVVGGVQQSLNSFFFLLSFGLGLVFPDPKEFHIYVAAGYVSVGIALLLYALTIYRRRDSFAPFSL